MIATTEIGWQVELQSQMHARGWTKYKLAKKSGLPQSTITSLLSGRVKNPSTDTLTRIANALCVSVSVLVREEDDQHQTGIDGSHLGVGLGRRIKQLRNKRNMNQSELAAKLGMSHSSIASWETGTRDPDTAMIVAIAEQFRVTTDYLLGAEGTTNGVIHLGNDLISLRTENEKLREQIRHLKDAIQSLVRGGFVS